MKDYIICSVLILDGYKYSGDSQSWNIGMVSDVKTWYRNSFSADTIWTEKKKETVGYLSV